ncbi:MAG: hypothetical protein KKG59_03280 [Nanoarchaeota archaeon]|nr:hypothetical protein [Nanoarchaeota archaeon]
MKRIVSEKEVPKNIKGDNTPLARRFERRFHRWEKEKEEDLQPVDGMTEQMVASERVFPNSLLLILILLIMFVALVRIGQQSYYNEECIDCEMRIYNWMFRGEMHSIQLEMDHALYSELKGTADFERLIVDPRQSKALQEIITQLQVYGYDSDETARLALSFVGHIPYNALETEDINYAYTTIYTNQGVCSDKSILAAALIAKLGYGVALLNFNDEQHMAIGIKCKNGEYLGYCFAEATRYYRVTYVPDTYQENVRLTSTPDVVEIADGKVFDASRDIQEIKEFKQWETRLKQLEKEIENNPADISKVKEYNELAGRIQEFLGT